MRLERARDERGRVGDGKADALQVPLARHAGNLARIRGRDEHRAAVDRRDRVRAAVERPVGAHRHDAVDRARQEADAAIFVGGDDNRAGRRRAGNGGGQFAAVLRVRGAEAHVDHLREVRRRGVEGARQRGDVRREREPEHLDREDLGVGRFLANRRGDGRTVAEAVDEITAQRPIFADCDAAGDAVDMRMRCVHAAVDHGDSHAPARAVLQKHRRQASPPRACRPVRRSGGVDGRTGRG